MSAAFWVVGVGAAGTPLPAPPLHTLHWPWLPGLPGHHPQHKMGHAFSSCCCHPGTEAWPRVDWAASPSFSSTPPWGSGGQADTACCLGERLRGCWLTVVVLGWGCWLPGAWLLLGPFCCWLAVVFCWLPGAGLTGLLGCCWLAVGLALVCWLAVAFSSLGARL